MVLKTNILHIFLFIFYASKQDTLERGPFRTLGPIFWNENLFKDQQTTLSTKF